MLFTTNIFFFIFLPVFLICYYLVDGIGARVTGKSIREVRKSLLSKLVVVCASLFFYAWSVTLDAGCLVVYCLFVYLFGRGISAASKAGKGGKKARILLAVSAAASIAILFYFKYVPTFFGFLGNRFPRVGEELQKITAPLGISFITFSVLSYLIDCYRLDADAGSVLDCFLYLTFFPKVVSGPIVAWKDFQPQIRRDSAEKNISGDKKTSAAKPFAGPVIASSVSKQITWSEDFSAGIRRIAIGFAKKVILADTLGSYVSSINYIPLDRTAAWFGWLAYAMQLYFDFAGYSDIAVGLARICGFDFKENFNFPYRSLSITEFWRRWHISLGAFFRNYLYIPLGGNRKGYARTLFNLAVVFLVTGIWHGAGAAYIIWGGVHGFCVVAERIHRHRKEGKTSGRTPHAAVCFLQWLITFCIAVTAWQFFRYGQFKPAVKAILQLFGANYFTGKYYPWQYYLDAKAWVILAAAFAGSILPGAGKIQELYGRLKKKDWFCLVRDLVLLLLLAYSITVMVSSNYHPFIYFKF